MKAWVHIHVKAGVKSMVMLIACRRTNSLLRLQLGSGTIAPLVTVASLAPRHVYNQIVVEAVPRLLLEILQNPQGATQGVDARSIFLGSYMWHRVTTE